MANFIFQVVKLSATGTRTTLSWNQRQILPHSKRTLFWANSIHMTKSASKLTAWHATQQDCNMCKQDRDWFKGLLCPDKHPMSTHTCAHHLGWAGMVWDHEFFSPFQIKIVLVWHSCVSTTFIVVMSISSLVVVLSALLYPGRRVATSSPPSPPFPLGWLGLFPGPKVAKLPQPPHFIFHPFHKSSCCHHGAKFSAASTNHFHLLHKSSCCKYHPFSAASTNHCHLIHNSSCCKHHPAPPLRVSVSLPAPPLSSLLPQWTGGLLSGWVEASLGAALHGDCFVANWESISLSCAQTELKLLLSRAGLPQCLNLLISSVFFGVPLKVWSLAHHWRFSCLTNITPYHWWHEHLLSSHSNSISSS